MSVRLLIADASEVIQAGLASLLQGAGIEIVATARTVDEAVHMTVDVSPDIVLVGGLPLDDDALHALVRIRQGKTSLPVLLFPTATTSAFLSQAVTNSASGVITKESSSDAIREGIEAAASGETLWSRDTLRRAGSASGNEPLIDVQLTPREGEVLAKLVNGLTNKQIAQELDISYETVKEHVQHVLRKIGVTDRTQAAVWAVRKGLV